MEKRYYLAYGSNLDVIQMKHRCPKAKPIGTANIYDYELLFKGSKTGSYLTIEQMNGSVVPVAVWEVSPANEKALDRYEGYPTFYYKKDVEVIMKTPGGNLEKIKAFVYIMHENRHIGVPTSAYMQTCLFGYRFFGFDKKILLDAYRKCEEVVLNESRKTDTA